MYVLYALSLLQVYISQIFNFCRLHILNLHSDHCTVRIQWVPKFPQMKLWQIAADSRNVANIKSHKSLCKYCIIDIHPCVPVDLVCIYIVSFVSFNLFLWTCRKCISITWIILGSHPPADVDDATMCMYWSSLVFIQCTCMRGMCECAHCIMHFDDHQHLVTLLKLFHHFKLYYYSNFFMQYMLFGLWETGNIPLLRCCL